MNYPFKRKALPERPAKEKAASFLTEAKEEHQALFAGYAARAEEFPVFEEFMSALQADAWRLAESLAKASWKNGIARGEARVARPAR